MAIERIKLTRAGEHDYKVWEEYTSGHEDDMTEFCLEEEVKGKCLIIKYEVWGDSGFGGVGRNTIDIFSKRTNLEKAVYEHALDYSIKKAERLKVKFINEVPPKYR